MSYSRVSIIYGVPLTEDCVDLINKWESDVTSDKWFEDDYGCCGFAQLYTAGGPPAGYCGVELDELKAYSNQGLADVRMKPTAAEKKQAKELVEKLDPELRARAGKIGLYFIWWDS